MRYTDHHISLSQPRELADEVVVEVMDCTLWKVTAYCLTLIIDEIVLYRSDSEWIIVHCYKEATGQLDGDFDARCKALHIHRQIINIQPDHWAAANRYDLRIKDK